MKGEGKWMERLTDVLELPGEDGIWKPLVELAGDSRVLMEHHGGILRYSEEEICVRVGYGHVRICGSDLELRRMTAQQLVISGQIDSITLIRR